MSSPPLDPFEPLRRRGMELPDGPVVMIMCDDYGVRPHAYRLVSSGANFDGRSVRVVLIPGASLSLRDPSQFMTAHPGLADLLRTAGSVILLDHRDCSYDSTAQGADGAFGGQRLYCSHMDSLKIASRCLLCAGAKVVFRGYARFAGGYLLHVDSISREEL